MIFPFLLLLFSSLQGAHHTPELDHYCRIVENDVSLQHYVKAFPFKEYRVFPVKRLGMFYLDPVQDIIKNFLRHGIFWEENIATLLKQHTREASIAIDMGSHIGIHVLTLSKAVGERGLVISFEPQRKLFREQYHNLVLNGCEHNVVILPYCVGDVEKKVELSPPLSKNEGGTSVGKGGDLTYMIPLDALALDNVSCIKMDVEAYELQVLKGAQQTLKRCRPTLIFEILGGHDLDALTADLRAHYEATLSFLTSLGYRVERLGDSNDFVARPQ